MELLIKQHIEQLIDFSKNNKELAAALVGLIGGWILTHLLPTFKSNLIKLFNIIGKKIGGRLSYRSIRDSYLNWVVLQNQDLNLTGIIGEGDKPKLEQIFTSLRIIGGEDDSRKERAKEDKQKSLYFLIINNLKKPFLLIHIVSKLVINEKIANHYSEQHLFVPDSLWRVKAILERSEMKAILENIFWLLLITAFMIAPISFIFSSKDMDSFWIFVSSSILGGTLAIGAINLLQKIKFNFFNLEDYFISIIAFFEFIFLIYIIYTRIIVEMEPPFAIIGGMIVGIIFFAVLLNGEASTNFNFSRGKSGETAREMGDLLSSYDNIAILGKPGSGKSTYIQYVALTFAQEKAGERSLRKKGIINQRFGNEQWYLPLLIPLRKISGFLIENSDLKDNLIIEAFRKNVLPSDICADLSTDYVLHMLKNRKCLLLLDGLDEVSDTNQFQAVVKEIRGLVSRFPGNKFILTSRYSGWRGGVGSNFKQFEIKDLEDHQIIKFIDNWYEAIEDNRYRISKDIESKAEKNHKKRTAIDKANNLKSALKQKNIRMLAENPLLLSIICFVHYHKTLPKERLRLYQDCSDLLLDQWDKEKGLQVGDTNLTLLHKSAIMQEIAFALHSGKIGDNLGRKEFTSEEILPIVQRMLKKFSKDETDASSLFQKLIERSGIIVVVERYSDKYSFSHLTFQEYYTAKYLFESQLDIFEFIGDPSSKHELTGWWREVLLLYSSMHKNPSKILNKLCCIDESDIVNQKTRIAAQCLLEAFENPGNNIENSILDQLISIRTGNNLQINLFPYNIKDYLLEFAMRPDFYRCSLSNLTSPFLGTYLKCIQDFALLLCDLGRDFFSVR